MTCSKAQTTLSAFGGIPERSAPFDLACQGGGACSPSADRQIRVRAAVANLPRFDCRLTSCRGPSSVATSHFSGDGKCTFLESLEGFLRLQTSSVLVFGLAQRLRQTSRDPLVGDEEALARIGGHNGGDERKVTKTRAKAYLEDHMSRDDVEVLETVQFDGRDFLGRV